MLEQGRLALVELILLARAVRIAHRPSSAPRGALGMGGAARRAGRPGVGGALGRAAAFFTGAGAAGSSSTGSGQVSSATGLPSAGGKAGCSRMIRSFSAFHFFS